MLHSSSALLLIYCVAPAEFQEDEQLSKFLQTFAPPTWQQHTHTVMLATARTLSPQNWHDNLRAYTPSEAAWHFSTHTCLTNPSYCLANCMEKFGWKTEASRNYNEISQYIKPSCSCGCTCGARNTHYTRVVATCVPQGVASCQSYAHQCLYAHYKFIIATPKWRTIALMVATVTTSRVLQLLYVVLVINRQQYAALCCYICCKSILIWKLLHKMASLNAFHTKHPAEIHTCVQHAACST